MSAALPSGGAGRNDAVTRVAGRLRAQGLDDFNELHRALLACPERAGLGEAEVRGIAKSAMNWPAGERRAVFASRSFRDAVDELAVRRGWRESALVAMGAVVGSSVSKQGKHTREVWWPMRSAEGGVVGWRRRRGDNKPFTVGKTLCASGSVLGADGKPVRWSGLMVSVWPLPEGLVLVTEGEADACAALSALPDLCVLAKPGARPGGRCVEWLQRALARRVAVRVVVLAPDGDPVGLRGAEETARALVAAGCVVKVIPPLDGQDLDKRLARVPEGERGAKLRDLLDNAIDWRPGMWSSAAAVESKGGVQSVALATKSKGSVESGEAVEVEAEVLGDGETGDDGRPVVRLSTDEAAVADEALGHLGAREGSLVFKRGGVLVTLDPGDAIDGPRVVPMEAPMVRDALSRAMRFEDEKGRAARPARWLAEAIVSRATLPAIKRLVSVVEAPTLLPDGRVVEAEGHDAGSGLFLVRRGNFPAIPEAPSKDAARAAAGRLLDVVGDFPLADETAKSVWLAALLSMVGREAIDGPVPMVGFDANIRGAGKTLVASLAALIATGRMPAMASVPESDAEMRKRITALAVEGARVALLDNAIEPVGGESLDACLTSTTWKDRLLGQSTMTAGLPMRIVWLATGNGLAFRGDMVRRALVCRLDSPLENPEARTGFAIPDVVAHVGRHRGALYVDAMTILRGFCAAGRPEVEVRPMGSFEAWASLVARAIVWCGLPDPIASRTVLAESGDADRDLLVALFVELDRQDPDGRGVLAAALVQSDSRPWCDAMDAALSGKPNAKTLAMKMAKLARRVVGGRRLGKRICQGAALWFVERAR